MLKIISTKEYNRLLEVEKQYNKIKPADRQYIKNLERKLKNIRNELERKSKKIDRYAQILGSIKK
jgi:hypothetical protein